MLKSLTYYAGGESGFWLLYEKKANLHMFNIITILII